MRIKEIKEKIKDIYMNKYKILLYITLGIVLLSLFQIVFQYYTEGDFIHRGVSLTGGLSLSVFLDKEINVELLSDRIKEEFPNEDFEIRFLQSSDFPFSFLIEITLDHSQTDSLLSVVEEQTGKLTSDDYSVEMIDSSLGESFFKQIIIAMLFAFILMAFVVYFYFKREFIPSIAVLLSAFTDIIVTLAIVNLMGTKLSIGGISAFLMLIGYSVDTDMLLSSKLLKSKKSMNIEEVHDIVIEAMKTGLTMSFTTLAILIVSLFFSNSVLMNQIIMILLIGLVVDLMSTWIQNVGILKMYLLRKKNKNET